MAKIKEQLQEGRDYIRGDVDKQSQASRDRQAADEARYAHMIGVGDTAYEPGLGGYGGYSDAERRDILREEELRAARTPEEELERGYLTPDEEAAIMGDPESRGKYFKPQEMLDRTLDKERQADAILGTMKEGMYAGITPGLSPSAGYYEQMDEAVSGTEDWLTEQADPGALRASEETLEAIRMSPEEEARMVSSAGKTAGNAYRAQLQQVDRASRAAGSGPEGVAARRLRYIRQSAVDSADAATAAKIAASEARAGRAGQAEYIRASGEGAATGLATRQGFGLGGMKMDKTQTAESTRLASERDVSSRRMGTAETVGRAGVDAKMRNLQAQQQQRQYSAALGTDLATGIERDTSARAGAIAASRQAVGQGIQATRYGQKLTESEILSGRQRGVADVRGEEGREARGYVREQQRLATGRGAGEANLQLGQYRARTGAGAANVGQAIQYDRTPGTAERIIGAGIGAAGKIIPGLMG